MIDPYDVALTSLRDQKALYETAIERHKSNSGHITTANDGRPARRSDEELTRLEEKLAEVCADIEVLESED